MTPMFVIFNLIKGSCPREVSNAQPSNSGFSPRPKVLKLYTIIAIFSRDTIENARFREFRIP